jgi:predicted Zn-dependent protease
VRRPSAGSAICCQRVIGSFIPVIQSQFGRLAPVRSILSRPSLVAGAAYTAGPAGSIAADHGRDVVVQESHVDEGAMMAEDATREQRYEVAEKLKAAGDLQGAVQVLEAVVVDHPDYALGFSALAAWCTRLERHADAVRHARRVCELEPRDPFSYTALSVACMRGGMISEAEEALARSRVLQTGG